MQTELNWTRACVERLDATMRTTRWHLDQVAEHRAGIAPVWNDACAREVAQRYLDPLTEEATGALTNVAQAGRDLHACVDAAQRAQECFDNAARLGRAVQQAIVEAQSLLRATSQQADDAVVHIEAARHQATRVQSLLSQADAAGGG